MVEAIRRQEPGGIDFVFDGIGGKEGESGLAVLSRGGKLVVYAAPVGLGSLLLGAVKMILINLLPNGRSVASYGISAVYMRDKKPFMEDLPLLFNLLAEGKIKPLISAQLPLLEARKANELLESGQVMNDPKFYEIRIEGEISARWSDWFTGLHIHQEQGNETILTGMLQDQAELHGVLMKIRDLHLVLISVNQISRAGKQT